MKIYDAVEKAMKQGKMIYRSHVWREKGLHNTFIKPTNSYDNCIVITYVDGKETKSCRNWNPTGNDLIADDWELWDEFTDKISDT